MKFHLKDLIWFVTLCAVLFAWYGDRKNHIWVIKSLEGTIDKQCHEIWALKDKRDWFWGDGIYRNAPPSEIYKGPVSSKPVEYLKHSNPNAHVYVPGLIDRASCAVCGHRATDPTTHLTRKLTEDDYPIIPAGD